MSSTDGTDPLRSEVARRLDDAGVRSGATVVAACSGGPDSTALLHALCADAAARGSVVVCAYLDHGIRPAPEREAESRAVEALATRCGAPLERDALAAGSLEGEARRSGASLEALARDARYRFLEAVADRRGASHIALGHTSDDLVETVLMRVLQGVDVSGLGGIPERRGRLLRPLARVSRSAVMAYLSRHALPSVSDSSNADPRYLRNLLRAELVPVLDRTVPSWRRSLVELARKARATHGFVSAAARGSVRWHRDGEGVSAPWAGFAALDGVPRLESTFQALDLLGARRVPYRLLEPLLAPIDPSRSLVLVAGGGWRVERRGELVHVGPDVVRRGKIGYLLSIRAPGTYAIPETGLVARVSPVSADAGKGPCLPPLPLVIRSARPGDRLSAGGARLHPERLVVPGAGRVAGLVPVVASRSGVAMVLGGAIGGHDVLSDDLRGVPRDGPAVSVELVVEGQ